MCVSRIPPSVRVVEGCPRRELRRLHVNRAELIDAIRDRLGASKSDAEDAVDAVLDTIQRAVAAGERVAITGFGVFEKVERAARTGRNPRTGQTVKVTRPTARGACRRWRRAASTRCCST